ncbi:hypothetical protein F5B21DRAFT_513529 [Xylaria acuta]|nr:hypothetical protein F5B21DRAFT_513529 [Xylaria acuta]
MVDVIHDWAFSLVAMVHQLEGAGAQQTYLSNPSCLILASLACVQSQDLKNTIVGCIEMECPAGTSNSNDNYTVAGNSFIYVGLTRVPNTQESLEGLSWIKGFSIISSPGNRMLLSSFFPSSSPDLNLDKTGACAVFLHDISTSLSLSEGKSDFSEGTCSDAMGADCVNALLDWTKTVVERSKNSSVSNVDLCFALQDDLRENIHDACLHVTRRPCTNLTSTMLAGNGSPDPISANENKTSNYWPGSYYAKDSLEVSLAITPILTAFYPSGEGNIVDSVEAFLTLLR